VCRPAVRATRNTGSAAAADMADGGELGAVVGRACATRWPASPFIVRAPTLVRRPGAPRAALTVGGDLPVGQRGSAYGASAGVARGGC
jgi:hypothetical protein